MLIVSSSLNRQHIYRLALSFRDQNIHKQSLQHTYNTLEMKAAALHFEVKEENVHMTTMFKCKHSNTRAL